MDIRITGAPRGGEIDAIPSKSAAHRIMIAAAMSGLDLQPYCDGLSADITATKECLQAFELSQKESPLKMPCGESGSTLRFLIPLAGALGADADFICQGRLPDRPMEPFLKVLEEHGCSVTGRNPKKLRGRLGAGDFCLPGNISSQYVTGLLMALPLIQGDSRIIVDGILQSRPYIDLTLQILAKAGIQIEETRSDQKTVFLVPGGQKYMLDEEDLKSIEGDWSNGAFWLVMDDMLRRRHEGEDDRVITVHGLDPASRQGDREIVNIIDKIRSADLMALRMKESSSDISVIARASFVDVNVSDIPDLVPAIAALACSRPVGAVTHISGAGRLRFKESDRLKTVTETLRALGAEIEEEPEGLTIGGTGMLYGGEVSSCGDHRIAMMAASAACITEGEILIRDADAVNKSYPGFFEDYRMLGGQVDQSD